MADLSVSTLATLLTSLEKALTASDKVQAEKVQLEARCLALRAEITFLENRLDTLRKAVALAQKQADTEIPLYTKRIEDAQKAK